MSPEILDIWGPKIVHILAIITPIWVKVASFLGIAADHPVITSVAFVLAGGTVANILVRTLNLIPLDRWFVIVRGAFQLLSLWGNKRYSAPVWAPFEKFLIKWVHGTSEAAIQGLESDNVEKMR